jgi:probable F420-dependent oxidoreductase
MKFGVMMFPTDQSIRPDDLAREAEDRGFESIFYPEHTNIPTTRKTAWPGGGDLPEEYRRLHDPFIALMAAAGATQSIKLGTGISLVAQHDPVVLAKTVASLDVLSNGRFVLGVGFGWNEDEMEQHGVDPHYRRTIVREKILAMKSLWTEEAGSFEGKFVRVEPTWSWPKPVQKPHPPILIGGVGSDTVFKHVIDWADGWMPIGGRYDILERVEVLRAQGAEAGRDPASIEITIFGAPRDPDVMERYEDAGVARVIFGLPPAPRDVVLPALDRRAAILQRVH